MLAGLEHAADPEEAEVAVVVRHAALVIVLDLEGRDREPLGELAGRRVDLDVLAQPGDGDFSHQNWRRRRRSFSQSSADVRQAVAEHGDPLQPEAEREAGDLLRVVADVLEHVRVDDAGAAHLDPAGVLADAAARAAAEEAGDVRARSTAR